jgi:hypothetical protein
VGPISYIGEAELKRDIDNFKAALKDLGITEAFFRSRRRPVSSRIAKTNITRAKRI